MDPNEEGTFDAGGPAEAQPDAPLAVAIGAGLPWVLPALMPMVDKKIINLDQAINISEVLEAEEVFLAAAALEQADIANPRKRKIQKQSKIEVPQNLDPKLVVVGSGQLSPGEIRQFFRHIGIYKDKTFQDDVKRHVRTLSRDGFVLFVRKVNEIVEGNAGRVTVKNVADTLNAITVSTTSHSNLPPSGLYDKARGRTPFAVQDNEQVHKYKTRTALLSWIVEEFIFSVDKCVNLANCTADVAQVAKDYYFPGGSTKIFTEIRSNCGMDPAESPSHAEVYDLHFLCVDFLGVIPKVTLKLDLLNRTSGVELVQTQRREHPRWTVAGLHKVVEEEGGVFIPTGPDLSESTEVLGEGQLVLIVKNISEVPDDDNGVVDYGGDSGPDDDSGHGDGDPADSPDPMEEDPPPPGFGPGGGMTPSPFGSGHGFGGGGNKSSQNLTHTNPCNDQTETSSDCSELPDPDDLALALPVFDVVGAFSSVVQQLHAAVFQSHHGRHSRPLQARRSLQELDFPERSKDRARVTNDVGKDEESKFVSDDCVVHGMQYGVNFMQCGPTDSVVGVDTDHLVSDLECGFRSSHWELGSQPLLVRMKKFRKKDKLRGRGKRQQKMRKNTKNKTRTTNKSLDSSSCETDPDMPAPWPPEAQDLAPHEAVMDAKRRRAKDWIVHINVFFAFCAVLLNLVMTSDVLYQFRKESHLWDRFGNLSAVLHVQLGATLGFSLLVLYTGRRFKQLLEKQRGRVFGPRVRVVIRVFSVVWSVLLMLSGFVSFVLFTNTRDLVICAKASANCDEHFHMCFAAAVFFPFVTFCLFGTLWVYFDAETRCSVTLNPRP